MHTERLIRFQHPEKVLGYLGPLDEHRLGPLFGVPAETFAGMRRQFAEHARSIAEDLLTGPAFAAAVDRLPFQPGQRVVAVGESTTADLVSWFEILRHLLDLRRPGDAITLVNLAVSGQSTSEALAALPALAFQRPDWVLCMLGGNDAVRVGGTGATRVSLAETERNLRLLRQAVPDAAWLWVAPTQADEPRVAAYQPFQRARLAWSNDDLSAIGRVLAALPEPVAALETPVHEEDGLHLSPAGQRALAEAVVARLS
ncbi:SGNH/GDSL hydrolase family protein [Nonomuraea typhae]|uniref:SGNH/GDSL hydrolase family protein n=1 Tax=Nonomuraea typhae TaxID=2603600 RepID=UPI0012F9F11D|nr:SGNH/GDSL hydrolase family protein [Nonomuraea typhae]